MLGISSAVFIMNFPINFYGMSFLTLRNNPAFIEKLLMNPINQIIILVVSPLHLSFAGVCISYILEQIIKGGVFDYSSNTNISLMILIASEAIGIINGLQIIELMNSYV